ncbi:MAG: DNA double-strand break repair nuclease NurA [Anaerolineae bacterium]|nr:DNA double-strand break repair nuclease NurA [Anaerolineae bacterium]
MLDLRKVAQALADKRQLFRGYSESQGSLLEHYRRQWLEVSATPRGTIEERLRASAWPGARPTDEHDRQEPVIPFGRRWRNHEEARVWARQVLEGVTTVAVDGSQISPSDDYYPPVGAVQIGWFENPHDPAGSYVKDISFEVLAPQELAGDQGGDYPDWQVNWRRFEGECLRLAACMREHRHRQPGPICFFDGSLIVSFAQHMRPERQACYVGAVTGLLAVSAECRVPLVAYVDASRAADLVAALDTMEGRPSSGHVSDGAFLRPLMAWGDRTPAWICARDDLVQPRDDKYYEQVAFVYLKTTADNLPVRLEFPRWLLEQGLLEHTIDVVRAECVIGNGYPYAVETADAVAVITAQDRERFYAAFERFAGREGLPLRLRRKAGSKGTRRQ